MNKSQLVPFEFLSEKEAMRRTPYQTVRTFRAHYGDLYRVPAEGKAGGYLSTELQARTESFTVSPREK